MLVLLDHSVPPDVRSSLRHRLVLYRPELSAARRRQRGAVLSRERPDVLLTRRIPDQVEISDWREATDHPLVVVLLGTPPDGAAESDANPVDRSYDRPRHPWIRVITCSRTPAGSESETDTDYYRRALGAAERERTALRLRPALSASLAGVRSVSASIALVGAGVVNLVTGLRLLRAGHRVTFYDRAPDPCGEAYWDAFGCSRGGADARMFTLTEADGYFGSQQAGPIPFLRPLKENGWCLADLARLSDAEVAWAQAHTDIPPWLARTLTEDVLSFNVAAEGLWRQLIEHEPELFDRVNLREKILRLYGDEAVLRIHAQRQRALTGEHCEILSPTAVADRYPALTDACRRGVFVGGLEVTGFTVQVHAFIRALVRSAELSGAVFHWERDIDGLVRAPSGLTEGLRSGDEVIRADHYVLSPGAYGTRLLRGTLSDDLVHGVVGSWLTLPNLEPKLENSLKLSRPAHIAADANVTVTEASDGSSFLVVGSGYGWTGANPWNIDPVQLDALYTAVEGTAEAFFPEAFSQARNSGLLRASRKYCVRPWTASSLPIFEIGGTERGGVVIITAGHNTGGFAQAPVIAEAVAAATHGVEHPMHLGYHPDRYRIVHHREEERGVLS